jgi:hypothetical protein
MAGNMKTLVIYDETLETVESLDKLKNIFYLAEYTHELVLLPLTELTDYNLLLSYQAVFCLSDTYFPISNYYINVCSVPEFELSLKQYYDKKSQFLLYGLPFSCSDIYLPANKKHSWKLIQSFVKQFNSLVHREPPIYNVNHETSTTTVPSTEVKIVAEEADATFKIEAQPIVAPESIVTTDGMTITPHIIKDLSDTLKHLASLLDTINGGG